MECGFQHAEKQEAFQPVVAIQVLHDGLEGEPALTDEAMAKALPEISITEFEEQSLLALYDLDNHSGLPAEIAEQAGHADESESKRGISDAGAKVAEYLALGPPQDSEEKEDSAPYQVLVTEQWDKNQAVWMFRPEVVYAIRKSWEGFVVPFDGPQSEPSEAQHNKSAFEVSESNKQRCLQAHNFRCWQCGLDSQKEYPGIATGFLEVRINPRRAGTIQSGFTDQERDLVPLRGRCLMQLADPRGSTKLTKFQHS